MLYAIISDPHANEEALRRVLRDIAKEGAEQVICLGDVVGYGPTPVEVIAALRSVNAQTLLGNHDEAVLDVDKAKDFIDLAGDAVKRHREAISASDRSWLASLPYMATFDNCAAVHGDFTAPEEFRYVETPDDAAENFSVRNEQLLFVGHTHTPAIFVIGSHGVVHALPPQDFRIEPSKRYLINPGSVGYPRESDGKCFSSYVLYDSEAETVRFRTIPFSVASVMQRGSGIRKRHVGRKVLVAVFLALAVLFSLFFCLHRSENAELKSALDLRLTEKHLVLEEGKKYVRANVTVDKGPVYVEISFFDIHGNPIALASERLRVKCKMHTRFKIPPYAKKAVFTISRPEKSASPVIREFNPASES